MDSKKDIVNLKKSHKKEMTTEEMAYYPDLLTLFYDVMFPKYYTLDITH